MNKDIPVTVFETVGSHLCVASEDGQKVYERLVKAIDQAKDEQNCVVLLSFRNVSVLTTAFLNTAIGQLYGKFDEEQINASLKIEDMEDGDRALLKRVVDTAKQYFQDPQGFREAARKAFEDDDNGS